MKPLNLSLAGSRTALVFKAGALFSAVLVLYHQDLAIVFNEGLQSELASYVLLVPFLFVYLVYRKRRILRAAISLDSRTSSQKILTDELPGALLCFLAFILYWQGSRTFYPLEYHLLSLPIFIAGCILVISNLQTLKVLIFPLVFLLFLTPPPMETIQGIGVNFATFTSQAATALLKMIGLPGTLVNQYGNPTLILQTQSQELVFTIDIACAGIYSLIGFIVFALFATYIIRGSVWKKGLNFLIGFPLVYALNILRVTLIIFIGYHFGQEIAMGVFHSFSGWILIFIGALTLFYLGEKIFKIRFFATETKQKQLFSCHRNSRKNERFCFKCGKILRHSDIIFSKRDVIKIVAILVFLVLVIPLNVPVFTLTKGSSEIVIYSPSGEDVTTEVLPEIGNYTLGFAYRDRAFEERSGQDASLLYVYTPGNRSRSTVWVSLEIANSMASLHYWEVCLLYTPQGYGRSPIVHTLNRREVLLLENPPIIGRFFSFQYINSTTAQVVLYWYESSLFDTGSNIEQKWVKTSLIVYTNDPKNYLLAENYLIPFAEEIIEYRQPLKAWPWVILVIVAQGRSIIAASVTLLGTILVVRVFREKNQKEFNFKAYKKLRLKKERDILRAVHEAGKRGKPVGKAIASSYHELAGKDIEMNLLQEKLIQAEEAGFVERSVISQEDEPIIVWKSLIAFPERTVV